MKVKLDSGAKKPTRAHDTDAGLDLYAMHGGLVRSHQSATFHTGVRVELPEGTAGVIMPKSGLMTRYDLLAFGIVDEGYDGEILVHIFNLGGEDYIVNPGDKITQMLIVPVRYEPVEIVGTLNAGARGDKGFGSTGR